MTQVGVDGAVLGADGDGGAQGLAGGVGVLADGLDVGAGVGLDALEDEALALEGVLDAGLAQVVEDDGDEVGGVAGRRGFAGRPVGASARADVAPASIRCGERLSTVNGPVTRMREVSS